MMNTARRPLSQRPRPVRLPGGEVVRLRPLRHDDAVAYEAFARELSAATLHNRLLGAGLAITPEGLARMLAVDQVTHVALVATARSSSGERIVGVARYALGADATTGELAVTVADDWQGRGVGRVLLAALMRRARTHGVGALYGDALSGNAAMLHLLASHGFSLAPVPGDMRLTRGTRLLGRRKGPPATTGSTPREALKEACPPPGLSPT